MVGSNYFQQATSDSTIYGELAQLARAPALHAGGHRFDSDILHDIRIEYLVDRLEISHILKI